MILLITFLGDLASKRMATRGSARVIRVNYSGGSSVFIGRGLGLRGASQVYGWSGHVIAAFGNQFTPSVRRQPPHADGQATT